MTTVKAVDLNDDEVIVENVQEISQGMGDVTYIWDTCGDHPLFGLRQCPDCKDIEGKTCGKWFVVDSIRSEPESIEIDGRPVKEIIEIV